VTNAKNGTGNGSELPRAIIHAEGVFLWEGNESGSIIHAEGVRVGVLSSAPKARRWGLPIAGDPFELAAYVLKILRADAHAEHFLNHGRK
jgi:hypothetical protein